MSALSVVAPVSLFIFSAHFGHFIPDNYDLAGVGGADAWCRSTGWAWRGREEGEAFTPSLLIPLLKGLCSIMPDSFRK